MYSKEWLYNLYVREQADEALYEGGIDNATRSKIYDLHKAGFYTPNIFVRIGFGLAIFVGVLFGLGFFSVFTLGDSFSSENGRHIYFGVVSLVFSIGCFFAAYGLITGSKDLNSGRDNMFVWLGTGFFIAFFALTFNVSSDVTYSLLLLVVTSIAAYIFYDTLLSAVAFLSLVSLVYFLCLRAGGVTGKAMASFALMATGGVIYYLFNTVLSRHVLYRNCIYYVKLLDLLVLYAAGNYYMVAQAATGFAGDGKVTIGGAFGAFYWCCTFGIPTIYLWLGYRRRDLMLLRTGVLLVVGGILTFRYYHSIMPPEVALTLAGPVCIGLGYWLIRRLHKPAKGFTSQRGYAGYEKTAVEQLLEQHTLKQEGPVPPADNDANTW